jgi:hypothetical protein
MGLLDKIKSAASALTGGADVFVDINDVERGVATPISIRGVAKKDNKISSVYLLVRATEHAAVENEKQTETVSYETRIEISGAQDLKQGEEYNWEGEINLPSTINPSFRGKMIRHTWEVKGGLNVNGIDPASDWREIEVR